MARVFKGFRFPLEIDVTTGQVGRESDYSRYVAQLIKQVLLTAPGERIDRPDFGAGLRRQLFAPSSETTATLLQTLVFQSLDRWLGDLITVDEVKTAFEDGRLEVDVVYTVKARGEREVLNLEVAL
ncbi:GPW/gp25 family protein [Paraliomyxa miuraensis]|uniref:GPW/gp25 family protein n=1 Tax=Paraliomyxa miuraensis TaxID=376150 RepID=UPI00225270FC|nr:GPW/gp25 family protein [Paraliomyxa miuraensis]MCX4245555.1 GPW/gp25 family protein [Paraliomyxa miuraensis]